MPENRGLGRQGQWILPGPRMPLRPFPDHAGNVIDQAVDASLPMMAMGCSFRHDKQMALVRDSQRSLQRSENNLVDIGIGIGMLIDQQALGPRFIGTG